MLNKVNNPTWYEFYQVISEWMPEFKLDTYDAHINGLFEARCRYLNKWKITQFIKFAKLYDKKMGIGRFFLLKLELAEITYKYDNMGKKTMQEALNYLPNPKGLTV